MKDVDDYTIRNRQQIAEWWRFCKGVDVKYIRRMCYCRIFLSSVSPAPSPAPCGVHLTSRRPIHIFTTFAKHSMTLKLSPHFYTIEKWRFL